MKKAYRLTIRSRSCSRTMRSTIRPTSALRVHWPRTPDVLPLGILYHNPDAPQYDMMTSVGMDMSIDDRLAGMNQALDHFAL